MAKRPLLYIGLMSGTSADGIDAALIEVTPTPKPFGIRLVHHVHVTFSRSLQDRIHRISREGRVHEICELNFDLGRRFAGAANRLMKAAAVSPSSIRAIGSHGQTIHHLPNGRHGSTLQIGESAVIAEETGIPVVSDFRVADMAAGGQGAPLVPFIDWILFRHSTEHRIVQNLGGIGNLTFLPAGAGLDSIRAFDTGPANMVIDGLMRRFTSGKATFDRNGSYGRAGTVSVELLSRLKRHPFFRKAPPKTTGREVFGEVFVERLIAKGISLGLRAQDMVATATALTAWSIAEAYRRFVFASVVPSDWDFRVIIGGGGAKNPFLQELLAKELAGLAPVGTHEDHGINSSAKEAMAFAALAHAHVESIPGNLPKVTGAKRPMVLGKLTGSSSWGLRRAPAEPISFQK